MGAPRDPAQVILGGGEEQNAPWRGGAYLRNCLLREGHILTLQCTECCSYWGGGTLPPISSLSPHHPPLPPPPPPRPTTRCTTCWGSLSRTTLGGGGRKKNQDKRGEQSAAVSTPQPPPPKPPTQNSPQHPWVGGEHQWGGRGGAPRCSPSIHNLIHGQEEPLHVLQQRSLLHVLPEGLRGGTG